MDDAGDVQSLADPFVFKEGKKGDMFTPSSSYVETIFQSVVKESGHDRTFNKKFCTTNSASEDKRQACGEPRHETETRVRRLYHTTVTETRRTRGGI